ncbi:uncharacterized protein [Venturia canescens]|uniref:uncharacterized protein n=1 Tax=Venturia canescens TaxID=32260 RepID=UPI001C9D4F60|nr:uncharacterized protein LOC122417733 [Venturia canescens]
MHRRRVRVDWNRIGSIDIDRVIGERDFSTIDDNVNNVVDYCLESEYDVKILDSNFVKLFRLAQLAVEYLLYCKQYLDHSVVILKEELRSKQNENSELRDELCAKEKSIKELRDKLKERSRIIETKLSDSHGEAHKCPECPKTFVSALFMNAHLSRRHPNVSRVSLSSPAHEQYRAETEKLHNEIKSLKERLNLTERVIRNETDKFFSSDNVDSRDNRETRTNDKSDAQNHRGRDDLIEEQHRRYQEEIGHLKATIFDEIRNLKFADKYPPEKSDDDPNLKELVREQQNEISRLRQQLSTKQNTEIERAETRRENQEEVWQSKMENLESRYRADIEKLYDKLKSTQESADRMRIDYMTRISDLERREASVESELVQARNAMNFNPKMKIFEEDKPGGTESLKSRSFREKKAPKKFLEEDESSDSGSETSSSKIESPRNEKPSRKAEETKCSKIETPRSEKPSRKDEEIKSARVKRRERESKETRQNSRKAPPDFRESLKNGDSKKRFSESLNRRTPHQVREYSEKKNQPQSGLQETEITPKKPRLVEEKKSSGKKLEIDGNSESISDEDSESWLESESSENSSGSEFEEEPIDEKRKTGRSENRLISIDRPLDDKPFSSLDLPIPRERGLEIFHSKLRELGIDPEWRGIPDATFKQVFEIVRHHRSINSKKYRKFEDIRRKLMGQLSRNLAVKEKDLKIQDSMERSQIERLVTNVRSKVSKALNILEKNDGSYSTNKLARREKPEVPKFPVDRSPSRRALETKKLVQPRGSLTSENSYENEPTRESRNSNLRRRTVGKDAGNEQKHLSHSYESIKDFIRDTNPHQPKSIFNVSGTLVASTPQKTEAILIGDSPLNANAAVRSSKHETAGSGLSTINSPRNNNKSVLKSSIGGSIGNLAKKKVLFDLQSSDVEERARDSPSIHLAAREPENLERNEKISSESDFEISSIHDEREQHRNDSGEAAKVLLLKTSQSEKIAQISQQIEQQLSIARRKPAGAIEAMFLEKFSLESEKKDSPSKLYESVKSPRSLSFENSVGSKNAQRNPSDRQSRDFRYPSTHKLEDDTKDTNLDLDIDELLRMESKWDTPMNGTVRQSETVDCPGLAEQMGKLEQSSWATIESGTAWDTGISENCSQSKTVDFCDHKFGTQSVIIIGENKKFEKNGDRSSCRVVGLQNRNGQRRRVSFDRGSNILRTMRRKNEPALSPVDIILKSYQEDSESETSSTGSQDIENDNFWPTVTIELSEDYDSYNRQPVENYLFEYRNLDKEEEEKYWNNRKNESTTRETIGNITEDKVTPTLETSNSSFWNNSETRDDNELNNNEAAVQHSIDADTLNQLDVYKNEEKIFYEKPKLNIQSVTYLYDSVLPTSVKCMNYVNSIEVDSEPLLEDFGCLEEESSTEEVKIGEKESAVETGSLREAVDSKSLKKCVKSQRSNETIDSEVKNEDLPLELEVDVEVVELTKSVKEVIQFPEIEEIAETAKSNERTVTPLSNEPETVDSSSSVDKEETNEALLPTIDHVDLINLYNEAFYFEEQSSYAKIEEIDLLSSIGRDIGVDLEKYVQPIPDLVAMETVQQIAPRSLPTIIKEPNLRADTNKLLDHEMPDISSADTRKKEKMARNQARRRLNSHSAPGQTRRPDKRRADHIVDNGPGGFDVYNIETAMPKIDLDAIESHLRAAREEERRRRNDREEIRRRLAMGPDAEDLRAERGRKPSLQSRLQSGMNLQICFMNESPSDTESPSSEKDSSPSASDLSSLSKIEQQSHRFASRPQLLSLPPLRVDTANPTSCSASSSSSVEPLDEADFFARQARLQTEARMALAQAKEMAHMQMEVERQRLKQSPITEMVRSSLEKVGVQLGEDRRRLSRVLLTELNVAQLQVVANDLHARIAMLNEALVEGLLRRDDLHMEQDSMLVDVEDLTRYLGAKQESLRKCSSCSRESQEQKQQQQQHQEKTIMVGPSSKNRGIQRTLRATSSLTREKMVKCLSSRRAA